MCDGPSCAANQCIPSVLRKKMADVVVSPEIDKLRVVILENSKAGEATGQKFHAIAIEVIAARETLAQTLAVTSNLDAAINKAANYTASSQTHLQLAHHQIKTFDQRPRRKRVGLHTALPRPMSKKLSKSNANKAGCSQCRSACAPPLASAD